MLTDVFAVSRWRLSGDLAAETETTRHQLMLYCEAVERYLRGSLPMCQEDRLRHVLEAMIRHSGIANRALKAPGPGFRRLLAALAMRAIQHAKTGDVTTCLDLALREIMQDPAVAGASDPDMDLAWAETVLRHAWQDLEGWVKAGEIGPEVLEVLRRATVSRDTLRAIAAGLGTGTAMVARHLARGRLLLRRAIAQRLSAVGEPDDHAAIDLLFGSLAP